MLPRITSVFLILTHQCNLKCKYCFVSQDKSTMSLEMACKGIDFAVHNLRGEKEKAKITFFGGEPLIRWDEVIVPAVLYAEKHYPGKVNFGITTNCVLLTKDKSEFIEVPSIN